jgi:hypothetical protein
LSALICDSGLLIAMSNPLDNHHVASGRLLSARSGRLVIPEPVLGETCNFLRNHVRNGPNLEARLLDVVTRDAGDFDVVNPTKDDRRRAAALVQQLVAAPLGYVDAMIIATAERLRIADIATVDFKFLGMASQVSRLKPLRWVLQES